MENMDDILSTGLPEQGETFKFSTPISAETTGESSDVIPLRNGTSDALDGGSGNLEVANTVSGTKGNESVRKDQAETSEGVWAETTGESSEVIPLRNGTSDALDGGSGNLEVATVSGETSKVSTPVWAETMGKESLEVIPLGDGPSGAFDGRSGNLDTVSSINGNEPVRKDQAETSESLWAETTGKSVEVIPLGDGTSGAFDGGSGNLKVTDTVNGAPSNSKVSTPVWAETTGESFEVTSLGNGPSGAFDAGSGNLEVGDTVTGTEQNKPVRIDQAEMSEDSTLILSEETAAISSSASSVSINTSSKKTKRKRSCGSQKRNKMLARMMAASSETNKIRKRKMEDTDDETYPDEPKRPKSQVNFNAVGVKMAIVPEDASRKITLEMVNPIRTAIWEMLETTQDPLPVVNAGTLISGAFHVSCEGTASAQWLRGLNGKIVEGVKLKVISAKDLPKPVKVAWKTRNTWCLDASRLLNIIQRFNPSINTKDWKIVNTLVEESHVRRIVLMDKASSDYIKAKGYCLQSGMDRSNFKLLEDPDGSVVDAQLWSQPSTSTASYQDEFDMLDIWEM